MKEGDRVGRREDCGPFELNSFTILTSFPKQIQRFWVSNKNKETLQILSWEYITNLVNKDGINIVLSGYITNKRINLRIEIKNKTKWENPELNVKEEVDTRIVFHVNDAVNNGFWEIVIDSDDTDVRVYILNYACYFQNMCVEEIWIQYDESNKTRFIPVHKLSIALGELKCKAFL